MLEGIPVNTHFPSSKLLPAFANSPVYWNTQAVHQELEATVSIEIALNFET